MNRAQQNPPMSEAMHHVMANLVALSDQLSELESELSAWVPDAGKVSAHTSEIRRRFSAGSAMPANGESSR